MEKRSRSKTGFRFFLAIPWLLLGSVYVFGAFMVAFLAWFAIVFTARYPEGLYSFNAGVLCYLARANAYFNLQTDAWPPFGFEEAPEYPRFHIVFRGRNAAGTHNVLSWGLAYQLRATAYFLLMTDTLPPISQQEPVTSA